MRDGIKTNRHDKRSLTEVKSKVNEETVVSIWSSQPWGPYPIRDVKGNRVLILFPGWRNRGAGPDFRDAVFNYGDGQTTQKGDVEIHLCSSDWLKHHHDSDPAYNNTRLHVVLYCDSKGEPRVTSQGAPLIEIELAPLVAPLIDKFAALDVTDPKPEPGPCGKEFTRLGFMEAKALLEAEGEARLNEKARIYEKALETESGEDILYRGIFEALGYSVYKKLFKRLAKAAPLKLLREIASGQAPERRAIWLQGTLMGLAGFLSCKVTAIEDADEETAKILSELCQVWIAVSSRYKLKSVIEPSEWRGKRTRPFNNPLPRLAGLSYFLAEHMESGLERLFGSLVMRVPEPGLPKEKKEWSQMIINLFPSPQTDYFSSRYTFNGKPVAKPRATISADRVALLMINIVAPFFLARYKTTGQNGAQIANLRRMIRILPKPSGHHVEKFMTNRLFGSARRRSGLLTALGQQGLINIYNRNCNNNPEGCLGCRYALYLQRF